MEQVGKIMHSYSIDDKRIKILGSIGGVSFLVSFFILEKINGFVDSINGLPYINDIPYIREISTFGAVFMAVFYLFDRLLWKFKLSKIPNLNGDWEGKIETSHNGKEFDIKVNIKQTWSSISIILETANSRSKSEVASISISKSRLVYQFFNEPLFITEKTLHKHNGITFLNFEGNDILNGHYFNDRDRGTYGDLYIERIKSLDTKICSS